MSENIGKEAHRTISGTQGGSRTRLLLRVLAVGLAAMLTLLIGACAPAAAPTPTPTTKPAAAPTTGAPAAKPTTASPAAPAATPTTAGPAAPAATPTAAAAAKPSAVSINAGLIYAKVSFHNAPYWVGQARGIFAQKGLEVKMTDFSDATTMMNTLGKDIDFASPSPQMPVQFNKSGRKDVRILGLLIVPTTQNFIIPASSSMKSAADLKGKKIGITLPGGSCHTSALLMLKDVGLKPEEVTFITGGAFPELWTAAKTGQTDTACQIPPTSASLVLKGEARYLWKVAEHVKGLPDGVIATTADVIKNKREALQRLTDSYLEAGKWIEANKEEAAKILAPAMGIPEDVTRAVLKEMPKGTYNTQITPEALQEVEETMKLGGTLEPSYKVPWAEIVDTSFLPPELRKDIR